MSMELAAQTSSNGLSKYCLRGFQKETLGFDEQNFGTLRLSLLGKAGRYRVSFCQTKLRLVEYVFE